MTAAQAHKLTVENEALRASEGDFIRMCGDLLAIARDEAGHDMRDACPCVGCRSRRRVDGEMVLHGLRRVRDLALSETRQERWRWAAYAALVVVSIVAVLT